MHAIKNIMTPLQQHSCKELQNLQICLRFFRPVTVSGDFPRLIVSGVHQKRGEKTECTPTIRPHLFTKTYDSMCFKLLIRMKIDLDMQHSIGSTIWWRRYLDEMGSCVVHSFSFVSRGDSWVPPGLDRVPI